MRIIGNWEAGFRSFTTNFPLNSPADAKGKKEGAAAPKTTVRKPRKIVKEGEKPEGETKE